MSNIEACIFDLDGVIVETSHFHFLAWRRLANEIGIDFDEQANEQLKGVSRVGSLERILEMGNKTLSPEEFEEMLGRKNGWYLEYLEDMKPSDALPGVVPFIQKLREKGIKISLASSSKNAKAIITKLDLNSLFDAIKDGNDVVHAKPDPDIFLQAASALKVAPANAIVFEDALAGIEAANAAKMRSVGIGDPSVIKDTNIVIGSFEELDYDKFIKIFEQ